MRPTIILLALLCVLAPHPARADSPVQVQKAIQAVCDRAAAAYEHGDIDGYMTLYARQFVGTGVTGGQSTWRQVRAGADEEFVNQKLTYKLSYTIKQVVLHGGIAQTVQEWHYRNFHPRTAGKAAYAFQIDTTQHAQWVNGVKGWQQMSQQTVRSVTTYSR